MCVTWIRLFSWNFGCGLQTSRSQRESSITCPMYNKDDFRFLTNFRLKIPLPSEAVCGLFCFIFRDILARDWPPLWHVDQGFHHVSCYSNAMAPPRCRALIAGELSLSKDSTRLDWGLLDVTGACHFLSIDCNQPDNIFVAICRCGQLCGSLVQLDEHKSSKNAPLQCHSLVQPNTALN